ncbi:hypothetical protein CORC01_09166, partial [Colletotrichum orchidophilum]
KDLKTLLYSTSFYSWLQQLGDSLPAFFSGISKRQSANLLSISAAKKSVGTTKLPTYSLFGPTQICKNKSNFNLDCFRSPAAPSTIFLFRET